MLELLASVLCFSLFIYKWLIIIAVLLTWVSADQYNPVVQWIARLTRPLWVYCEQNMPVMMAHFSPYASLLLVIFAQAIIPAEIKSFDLLLNNNIEGMELLMQSIGHLMQGLAIVMQSLIFFFIVILIAWFFLTLVNPSLNNTFVRIIHVLADPIITPIQRYLPRTSVDFSPLVCLLLFIMMQMFLIDPINHLGGRLSSPVILCTY